MEHGTSLQCLNSRWSKCGEYHEILFFIASMYDHSDYPLYHIMLRQRISLYTLSATAYFESAICQFLMKQPSYVTTFHSWVMNIYVVATET